MAESIRGSSDGRTLNEIDISVGQMCHSADVYKASIDHNVWCCDRDDDWEGGER